MGFDAGGWVAVGLGHQQARNTAQLGRVEVSILRHNLFTCQRACHCLHALCFARPYIRMAKSTCCISQRDLLMGDVFVA